MIEHHFIDWIVEFKSSRIRKIYHIVLCPCYNLMELSSVFSFPFFRDKRLEKSALEIMKKKKKKKLINLFMIIREGRFEC